MSGAPVDLVGRWSTLPKPAGERLSAERVRDWAGGPVLVAVDAQGRNHLLVRLHTSTVALPRPLRGLDMQVRLLQPPGQTEATWLDLTPTDEGNARPFIGLASDVVAELPTEGPPDPGTLFRVIERWRRFFGRTSDGLTREAQLGLVGELWLLLEWLPAVTAAAVDAWKGPLGGRHDWVSSAGLSIEVKTTGSSTGPVVHRIGRLDQLDEPAGGRLYLLSVRAVPDASGSDSLDGLLGRARTAATAAGPTCAGLLDDRLRALDVTLADIGRYRDPFRVTQAELFQVVQGFPRLVPSSFPGGLPVGVTDLAYNLDTSACGAWRLASRPEDTQVLAALTA